MAFIRSSEPFQEPPAPRSRGLLAIGVVALLILFVPLVVIIAVDQGHGPVSAAAQGSASAQGSAAAPPAQTQGQAQGPVQGAGNLGPPPPPQHLPPLPPPGAPWPPPPGAPVPPTCSLEYRVNADGSTTWTALTLLGGQLTAESHSAGPVHRHSLTVPQAVKTVSFPAALSRDHTLSAYLTSAGHRFTCLVGPQVDPPPR